MWSKPSMPPNRRTPEVGDVLHDALANLAVFELFEQCFAVFFPLPLDERPS